MNWLNKRWSDDESDSFELMLGRTSHSETVSKGNFVQFKSIDRDSTTDKLACEFKVACETLSVIYKVALTSAAFPDVVVHAVRARIENGSIAQRLWDVLCHSLWLIMGAKVSQRSLHVKLSEALGWVEPASWACTCRDDQSARFKFTDEVAIDLEPEDWRLTDVFLCTEDLIETVLLMMHTSHLVVHFKEQSLPHEELKVLSFDVAHHLEDVIVASRMEDLTIAKTADWTLWVRIDAQNRHVSVLNHASRL